MRTPPPADAVPFHRFGGNGYFYSTVYSQGTGRPYAGLQCYVLTNQSRPGTVPLYRFRGSNGYFYTNNYDEGANAGMIFEGVQCYVFP